MQHSPAPWHYGIKRGHSAKFIYDAQGGEVADCDIPFNSADANTANMRLATAAPDLLNALEKLMQMRDKCFIPNDVNWWDDLANAAIAKAKGV